MDTNEPYIKASEACRIIGVDRRTLYTWEKTGKIHPIRTKGGQCRYLRSEIAPPAQGLTKQETPEKRKIAYCRVSTSSQKEDLERQVGFFQLKYPQYEIIKDIGSGINSKRKGFLAILDASIKGEVQEIVVTHKDRLCRFNFDLIKRIVETYSNGKIVVLNQRATSPNEELVDDLLSIITVFSARVHGLRSQVLKNQIKEATTLQNVEDENLSDK